MSTSGTVTVRPLPKYTEPNRKQLIGEWSEKRYRSHLEFTCVFHKDGNTHVLNQGGKYSVVPDEEFFKEMREASKNGGGFMHPYTPMKLTFDRANSERTYPKDSQTIEFLTACPSVVYDGKHHEITPGQTMVEMLSISSSDVVSEKSFDDLTIRMEIQNFVKELTIEKKKDIVYFIGEGNTPANTDKDLMIQLVGEKGLLWGNDSKGNNIAEIFQNTFMTDEAKADTDLILTCNKAIAISLIQLKSGGNGSQASYYWKDTFLDVSKEGVYSFFGKDPRMLESLKGEIARRTGGIEKKDSEIIPKGVATTSTRGEKIAEIKRLIADGTITLKDKERADNLPNVRVEEILNSIKEKETITE
jgi:hypothetical protein